MEFDITVGRKKYKVFAFNTIIVGSGASGYNAADRLHDLGQTNIAIVTEGVGMGTSRNAGSDKQTYYKLSLSGGDPDSVHDLAETIFCGLCVDGDIALCEAALSAQSFLRLVELGVPFPRNRYGEYVGYKTDHDPRRRATSAGPYTSRMMTEALEESVTRKHICVFDEIQVVKLITNDGEIKGLLGLDTATGEFNLFVCKNVIYCVGGPAGIYNDSVYPLEHSGASGIAFEAGAVGKNLTEWQYGIASIQPRWNVSGTYMQSLPKFISTDQNGTDSREFLWDFFKEQTAILNNVFLKGYQWPFDVRKIDSGSSIIDILVHIETNKNRRVYLDFRENPINLEPNYSILASEAREYLEKAGACWGKPIDRLNHMNPLSVDFYRNNGVDITKEPLEIALCAQHNNGGLGVDCWWQSNIKGFFVAGEAAATHGVYRPGGSALNAGQVGSLRAAQYITANRQGEAIYDVNIMKTCLEEALHFAGSIIGKGDNIDDLRKSAAMNMSRVGSAIRDIDEIKTAARSVKKTLDHFETKARIPDAKKLSRAFRFRDTLVSQFVYLSAMINYAEHSMGSRGSALYIDKNGRKPHIGLPEVFRYTLDCKNTIQETYFTNGECRFNWREPRPIPEDTDFFENIWRSFRENGNIS
jgi:succinate dehydrogenase/fumarate reductase flavoprotein subunit